MALYLLIVPDATHGPPHYLPCVRSKSLRGYRNGLIVSSGSELSSDQSVKHSQALRAEIEVLSPELSDPFDTPFCLTKHLSRRLFTGFLETIFNPPLHLSLCSCTARLKSSQILRRCSFTGTEEAKEGFGTGDAFLYRWLQLLQGAGGDG